jgi:DNA polymerase-3 subunit gamma/tau
MVAYNIDVLAFDGDVLTLRFASNYDVESFKTEAGAPDVLRKAIEEEFGIVVKFKPQLSEAQATSVTASVPVVEETPSRNANVNEDARYGESLLREILGAEPLDE